MILKLRPEVQDHYQNFIFQGKGCHEIDTNHTVILKNHNNNKQKLQNSACNFASIWNMQQAVNSDATFIPASGFSLHSCMVMSFSF